MGDLIYTFGWALWTGAVVAWFVQIWPQTKRRQYKQVLDAYEAAVGRQAQTGSGQAPVAARMGHNSERAAMIYQHEARGADQAMTNAIDSHVQTEQHKSDDDDGSSGAAVIAG